MKIKADIYRDGRFKNGTLCVLDGVFGEECEGQTREFDGLVIPGLVDMHCHGAAGAQFISGKREQLEACSLWLAKNGTTSFAAAGMTLPEEELRAFFEAVAGYRKNPAKNGAYPAAIYMEGPFFCAGRAGAQAKEHLRAPDIAMTQRLLSAADGMLRVVCLAPELPGADKYIERFREEFTLSIAHTNASYDTARFAIECGMSHITHLYNAMPPLLHREPGVIGAGAQSAATAELICDGVHVHESAVRAAFSLFSRERIALVSDSIWAAGLPEGSRRRFGDREVTVSRGAAVFEDGVLAGGTSSLLDCVKKAGEFGIPFEDAVYCATSVPARILGQHDIGEISPGRRADFLLLDRNRKLAEVYIGGRRVF